MVSDMIKDKYLCNLGIETKNRCMCGCFVCVCGGRGGRAGGGGDI